jgi:predicted lipoprotein with Yx(FWY)xxD motif
VALTNASGQTLYFPERDTDHVDLRVWRPVTAPSLARTDLPDWSVVTLAGKAQWTYRGKPLFTYTNDANSIVASNRILADIFGSTYGKPVAGWQVALLKAAPAHPRQVTIRTIVDDTFSVERSTFWKKIYADPKGMTLYVIQCVENTAEPVECDDVGDSPSYWLNYCGGEVRCAKTWHPLAAPADAQPIDATWSPVDINPAHPWKPLEPGSRGVHVWAYHGRPVFTFAQDMHPGDVNAAVHYFGSGQLIYARKLLAYEKR